MNIYEFEPDDAYRFVRDIRATAKRNGDELAFTYCPYCNGGNGSKRDKGTFSINLETGQFKCLRASCNAQGNMITLARDFNFDLSEDVNRYFNINNYNQKFKRFKESNKASTGPAVEYLRNRGISEETCRKYEITTKKDQDNIIVFPFKDQKGELRFIKYRKADFDKAKDKNKEWCEADCMPILFGMNHCDPELDYLVITEGQIDSLSVTEAGIKNAVSVPTGANGFTWVPHCWDFLAQYSKLLVFGDFEEGSMSLLDELIKRFHGAIKRVREEDYKGCKDANEILQKYGKEAVKAAVDNAVPINNPKIKRLVDVQRVELSNMEYISSGINSLDKLLGGFYFGQVVLLTGERGFGKSTLVSQFGTLAMKKHNVFFYSGELMDWYLKAWIEYQIAGNRNINGMTNSVGYKSYSIDARVYPQIEQWYGDRAYIYDNSIVAGDTEEETLLETLETAIKQYDCRVLIIDNLMTAIADDITTDLYRVQAKFVRELTLLAKKYNVLIFLIVHPRKSNGYNFDNDDVAGSSNITNLVDVVLRYGKPKEENVSADTNERVLAVYKNRLTGRTNRDGIKLYYQESSKRISEDGLFDWELGWEKHDFVTVNELDNLEIPF